MAFKVMSKRCDQCLMGPSKLVSNARQKQILADTLRKDCHFICHKATISGQDIACRGHYDATGGGKLGRFSDWLGITEFIDPPEPHHD